MTGSVPAGRPASDADGEPPQREAVLLVNVRSRRGAALHGPLRRLLEERGVRIVAEHLVTDPANQLATLVPRILARSPQLLVVGSGDGTVATVVDHLAHTDTVLGYVPMGTTNNFGRSLGLPLRMADAVDVVVHGTVARADLGRVNGDLFANLVSIGVSAEVAGATPHLLKRHLGRVAYALTAGRALVRHRPFTAEVRSGDTTWRVRTHQLNIANGRMHGGSVIARDATLDDRLLVAYALGGSSRWSTVWAAARQVVTPWQPLERKGYLTGTDFHVTTDVPLPVDVDGEIVGRTPVHVEVDAEALRVMVPRAAVEPRSAAPG